MQVFCYLWFADFGIFVALRDRVLLALYSHLELMRALVVSTCFILFVSAIGEHVIVCYTMHLLLATLLKCTAGLWSY